jgi:hypothetical protein
VRLVRRRLPGQFGGHVGQESLDIAALAEDEARRQPIGRAVETRWIR